MVATETLNVLATVTCLCPASIVCSTRCRKSCEYAFICEVYHSAILLNSALDVRGADLSQEDLSGLPLACMQGGLAFGGQLDATVEQTNIAAARMKEANLAWTQLQRADLDGAQLQEANLNEAKLQRADLYKADLQGADLREAQLDSVDLKEATLSDEKYGPAMLADVMWGEINLAVVDWTPVTMVGDERKARQQKTSDGMMKDKGTRINEFLSFD